MKAKYILSFALAGSALLAGCKKDFLDAQPTQFTTPEQLAGAAAQDPNLLNGSVAGLYTTMFNVGVGGTTGHDDFGQKAVDIYTDMLQSDMVLGALNYGWYSGVARYQATTDFTLNAAYMPWRYFYRQIYGANTIIDVLGGQDVTPTDPVNKATMGQAKAMRAYAYFYLSQLYVKEYGTGNEKALPIYTSIDDLNMPKGTTAQLWNLMIDDLTDAVALLDGFQRTSKDQINQNVAKGLLSYVLAARGTQQDWQQVETLTADIVAAYPKTTAAQALGGFNNVSTPSWMWGVDITLSQGLDLISWWGQVDLFTYSYAWAGDPKTIDQKLYDAIRADDIRKGQFDPPNGGYESNPQSIANGYADGDMDYMPINKFYAPERIIGGQRQITTDQHYMRADEFYLLNAEAKARLGKEADAKSILTSYLADRITNTGYINALAGQALLDEIYLQTRIELWGEGKAYLALKRNKATVNRGDNHLFEVGVPIPYSDEKITFDIPQAEVLNNPNLDK
ncbi:MAG: RagB/SusD family nutrient uptake outer membrane protein [Sphingobacteriales bacterium]|nr:MAG: RagB/SusD family nutrient uptake outer membrane protein [Sphingobacteriales bacterium]